MRQTDRFGSGYFSLETSRPFAEHCAAGTDEFRPAQFGSEQYNSSMALAALAKKLFRTLAKVIPQCGMVSQAVAFNMFLAFFAVLLTTLSLVKSSLEGEGGQQVAMRISAVLPPGTWQLISAYVLRREVNAWYLAFIGWVGTLLVGSQVIKLIIKGIELIYGDHATHSFLGRQIRGLLLFSLASLVWLVAVALSVFGQPLADIIRERCLRARSLLFSSVVKM
jgi:membrane protein